jgi:YHS domain-containing protein
MIVALLLAAMAAAPSPEDCIASANVAVTHAGKTYRLASDACRAQFLSDPERYSQLYDALLELRASGATVAAAPASAVPS